MEKFKVGDRLTYKKAKYSELKDYSVIILNKEEVKYKTNPLTTVYTVYCTRNNKIAKFDDWMLIKGLWYTVEHLEPKMIKALYGDLNV